MNYIKVEKSVLEELVNKKLNAFQIAEELNISHHTVRKRLKEHGLKINHKHVHTEETKKIISEKRKKWLKENPDKHPWKQKDKFKSKPCQKVKEFLQELNINYIEEFQPLVENRYFSIDIALPDKKIGLEINGNQHYEKSGILKKYYKERENILNNAGWKIYQIHYSACFDIEKWKNFFEQLNNFPDVVNFDYFTYKPRLVQENFCIDCNSKINIQSLRCIKCRASYEKEIKFRRRVIWATKEQLEKLIWEIPTVHIAKTFGVSDITISKWCEFYKIDKPPRGYWKKLESARKRTRTSI